jgi:O-antigen ligase/Flp pilus assembly protein TadD
VALLALAAALPLVVDPAGHQRHTAARFAAAGLLLVAAAALQPRRRPAPAALPRPVVLAWIGVAVASALSSLFAPDPLLSLLGDPVRFGGLVGLAGLATGFVLAHRAGPHLLPRLALVVVGASLPTSAVAVAQGLGLGSDPERATGLSGTAAFLAAHLCLAVPLAAALVLDRARPRWWRAVAALALALGVGATAASETRGAWVAVAMGLLLVSWRNVPRLPAVGAALAVVAIALLVPLGSRGGAADPGGTGRGRVDTWAETVDVVLARPILGWGNEGFRRGFAAEVGDGWVREYGLDRIPDRAHNRFLDAAAAGGAVGLAADLSLVGVVGVTLARRLRAGGGGSSHRLALGTAAGLTAWLVQGQALFDVFDSTLLAWVLAGAALAATAPTERPPTGPPARRGRLAMAALVTASVVVAGVGLAGFASDRTVRSASGAPAATALDRLHRATQLRPRSLEATALLARVAIAGDDPALLDQAHRWLDRWDDPDVTLRDADVLAALARQRGTAAALDAAVARYREGLDDWPANGPGWLGLGQALLDAGRLDEARAALERAHALLPGATGPMLNLGFLAFAEGDDAAGCRWFAEVADARDAPTVEEQVAALVAASGSAATCGTP